MIYTETFHEDNLKEHSMKIINFIKKKMELIKSEQQDSYENQKMFFNILI